MTPVKPPVYVLEAQALLRLAQDEPGAERIAAVLEQAQAGQCRVLLHQISLGEVVYRIGREFGWPVARRKRQEILLLPIEIVPFSEDLFWDAVEFMAVEPQAHATGFAAVLARQRKAILLSGDPEPAAQVVQAVRRYGLRLGGDVGAVGVPSAADGVDGDPA